MNSGYESEAVVDALGDKVTAAIVQAVAAARADLASYRQQFPQWVAEASQVGLANWINDRVWAHLEVEVDGLSDTYVRKAGSTRELFVGTEFRLRVKRHDASGRTETYPTQTAIEFYDSEVLSQIPGLEELCLTAGYIWSRDDRALGAAVIALSMKLGVPPRWVVTLPGQDEVPMQLRGPDAGGPTPPSIDTDLGHEDLAQEEGDPQA